MLLFAPGQLCPSCGATCSPESSARSPHALNKRLFRCLLEGGHISSKKTSNYMQNTVHSTMHSFRQGSFLCSSHAFTTCWCFLWGWFFGGYQHSLSHWALPPFCESFSPFNVKLSAHLVHINPRSLSLSLILPLSLSLSSTSFLSDSL